MVPLDSNHIETLAGDTRHRSLFSHRLFHYQNFKRFQIELIRR